MIDGSVDAFRRDHPDAGDPTDMFLDQHGDAGEVVDNGEEIET